MSRGKATGREFGVAIRERDGGGGPVPSIGDIGLNQFAPYLMNRVAARWNAVLQDDLRGHELTTVKMRTLAILTISAGLTVNELSLLAVTEQSTMSRTLDGMEEQGLIRRRAREDDLRVRVVDITEAGRDAFARFWPTMYQRFSELVDGVGEEEYRAFVATLHKLMRNQQRLQP